MMLRPKKLEIRNKIPENCRRAGKTPHKIEPNLLKDRAMQEGDNPSF
jgi:hypothetical protein